MQLIPSNSVGVLANDEETLQALLATIGTGAILMIPASRANVHLAKDKASERRQRSQAPPQDRAKDAKGVVVADEPQRAVVLPHTPRVRRLRYRSTLRKNANLRNLVDPKRAAQTYRVLSTIHRRGEKGATEAEVVKLTGGKVQHTGFSSTKDWLCKKGLLVAEPDVQPEVAPSRRRRSRSRKS